MKTLLSEKSISELQALEIRNETKKFLVAMVQKILEKSPIKYRLVRNLSCLDPAILCRDPEHAVSRFKRVLHALLEANRVRRDHVDDLVESFSNFAIDMKKNAAFISFDYLKDDLDSLYYIHLKDAYPELWEVVRRLLLLSHGQAAIERGFSINKCTSVTNLQEQTLVNLRFVKDHIRSVGGLRQISVTKELITSCSSARQKYVQDLQRKQEDEKVAKKRGSVSLLAMNVTRSVGILNG
jgi:hypothetical protein